MRCSRLLSIFNKYLTRCHYSSSASELQVHQIETPLFRKILTPELEYLNELFAKNNFKLRIAGGAVRDLLLDIEPQDVDLATDALPKQMVDIFRRENVRILTMNGYSHGTVPVRIKDKVNYDITTLRIDVKTYGRHAEVAFTNNWHLDAIRRDFTINSLFLDFDGQIHDYVRGVDDLRNRVVRFVGIADKRVKEDYLRILRYFRFYGRVCPVDNRHDQVSLNAIRDNVNGLGGISSERILVELKKILTNRFSNSFIRMFYDLNMSKYLGLPSSNPDFEEYSRVYNISRKESMNPFTLLSALFNENNKNQLEGLFERLKISNDEKYLMCTIIKYKQVFKERPDLIDNKEECMRYFRRELARDQFTELMRKKRPVRKHDLIELVKYMNKLEYTHDIENLTWPKFELDAATLAQHTLRGSNETVHEMITRKKQKLSVNRLLGDLKKQWIDSNFEMSQEQLLSSLDEGVINNYLNTKSK